MASGVVECWASGECPGTGGMAEWTMAAVLKTVVAFTGHRGFESLSLRQGLFFTAKLVVYGEVPEWTIGTAC